MVIHEIPSILEGVRLVGVIFLIMIFVLLGVVNRICRNIDRLCGWDPVRMIIVSVVIFVVSFRDLRSVVRDLRGFVRDLRGLVRGLRGVVRDLRAVVRDLRGIVRDFRGVVRDLRGIFRDLRGGVRDFRDVIEGIAATSRNLFPHGWSTFIDFYSLLHWFRTRQRCMDSVTY